jgi:hypothetical protein
MHRTCWQNEEFLGITAGGAHSFHWDWKVAVSAVGKESKARFIIDQIFAIGLHGQNFQL